MDELHTMALAINTYGCHNQVIKAIEEMSELQKELCKGLSGKLTLAQVDNIAVEIADTEIMLEQLKMIYGIHKPVEEWKHLKLLRLANRLEVKAHETQTK